MEILKPVHAGRISRREAMLAAVAGGAVAGWGRRAFAGESGAASYGGRIPVIDVTDLYHPPQDVGDNLDLLAAFALPEIDLKAVILDCTQRYRRPFHDAANPAYDDPAGGRDPGFVPVLQLNHLFGRNVPCAVAPFAAMRAPDDPMLDAPCFQQGGVELLLQVLKDAVSPVEIVSFGSARPVALAFNRAPDLMRERVGRVHLCAGASPPGFLEWNVQLDVHAFVRMLSSGLPLALYPCAAETSAWDLGQHNTYWQLPDRSFLRRMHPRLQSYLAFALDRTARMDFLCAVEDPAPTDMMEQACAGVHHVWETAVWAQVSGRRAARKRGGVWRLVPEAEIGPEEEVVEEGLAEGRIQVRPEGHFDFVEEAGGGAWRYFRRDPQGYQSAMAEAFPALYTSFALPGERDPGA